MLDRRFPLDAQQTASHPPVKRPGIEPALVPCGIDMKDAPLGMKPMRRTTNRVSPNVDVMEPRVLLSVARPLLNHHALRGVVQGVRAIMSTLARTGDTVQATDDLIRLSSRVPSGPESLAPTWQKHLGLYRPHSSGSIL